MIKLTDALYGYSWEFDPDEVEFWTVRENDEDWPYEEFGYDSIKHCPKGTSICVEYVDPTLDHCGDSDYFLAKETVEEVMDQLRKNGKEIV